jgi:sugar-specific transcriptional regulator TrmB
MSPQNLIDIGLTAAQAKAYLTLIQKGKTTPPELAKLINETRSNTYMVLEQLEKLGLVKKSETDKKTSYTVENPIALEKVAEARRKQLHDNEMKVKQAMPSLLSYFYSHTEKPGVRMVEGLDGLKSIYEETLRVGEPIYLVRTSQEVSHLGIDYINKYREKRKNRGVHTKAITPDLPEVNHDPEVDKEYLFERTWVKPEDYTAPVEINIYGDKVSFAVFGQETMGVILDNDKIADAMRQLVGLASK